MTSYISMWVELIKQVCILMSGLQIWTTDWLKPKNVSGNMSFCLKYSIKVR